jgi:hypothetical protein
MTNAKKHIIAPRAQNQEDMMLWFQGTFYNLGERYTVRRGLFYSSHCDAVFLKLFNHSIFPGFDKDYLRGLLLFGPVPFCVCLWVHNSIDSVFRGQILTLPALGLEPTAGCRSCYF